MKRILIISQYIAPVRAIASVRWTKISKYLKRNYDVSISVLTNRKTYSNDDSALKYEKDNLLEKDMGCFDWYYEFETGKLQDRLYKIKGALSKGGKSGHPSPNVGSSGTGRFAEPSIRHTVNSVFQDLGTRETVRDGYAFYRHLNKKFDIIVSTYGPVWPHLLAKRISADNPSAIWVADFRDIYAGNPYETERDFKRHKKFVGRELKEASIILKVAEGLNLYEDSGQKVATLSNGFDWEEKRNPLEPDKFDLVYTGTFYPEETNLLLVFRALKELLHEQVIDTKDLRIIYAGKNGDEFERQAYAAGVGSYIQNRGFVQREVVLGLQQRAAILLQSYSYTASFRSLWSGKMFEYMMAEKPIVFEVVGDTPSEQYKLMPKLGGIGVESCRVEETYPQMKDYIASKYLEWKATGNVSIQRDDDYVRSFSYERLTDTFWNLIGRDNGIYV